MSIVKKLTIEANRKAAECTFKKIAKEWHEMFKSQWASVHADDVIRSLERDVFPAIGKFPIADLNPPMILKVLRDIEARGRSEEHTSELQSLMRISYAVFCLK